MTLIVVWSLKFDFSPPSCPYHSGPRHFVTQKYSAQKVIRYIKNVVVVLRIETNDRDPIYIVQAHHQQALVLLTVLETVKSPFKPWKHYLSVSRPTLGLLPGMNEYFAEPSEVYYK